MTSSPLTVGHWLNPLSINFTTKSTWRTFLRTSEPAAALWLLWLSRCMRRPSQQIYWGWSEWSRTSLCLRSCHISGLCHCLYSSHVYWIMFAIQTARHAAQRSFSSFIPFSFPPILFYSVFFSVIMFIVDFRLTRSWIFDVLSVLVESVQLVRTFSLSSLFWRQKHRFLSDAVLSLTWQVQTQGASPFNQKERMGQKWEQGGGAGNKVVLWRHLVAGCGNTPLGGYSN